MVQPIATRPFLLGFALFRFLLFIAALRELGTLVVGVEPPPRVELGAVRVVVVRFGRCVDEAEGGVFVRSKGCEGVVAGEIKGGISGVVTALSGPGATRIVHIPGPIGDPSQSLGAGEGSEWDIRGVVRDREADSCRFRRTPAVGIERHGTNFESHHCCCLCDLRDTELGIRVFCVYKNPRRLGFLYRCFFFFITIVCCCLNKWARIFGHFVVRPTVPFFYFFFCTLFIYFKIYLCLLNLERDKYGLNSDKSKYE